MTPAERLRCFGSDPLTFRGTIMPRGSPGAFFDGEPEWLADEAEWELVGVSGPAAEGGRLELHFPPTIDITGLASEVNLRGHFDDPMAGECVRAAAVEVWPDQSALESQLWCRQQFVVEAVEPAE
jgi:hypothetical protein